MQVEHAGQLCRAGGAARGVHWLPVAAGQLLAPGTCQEEVRAHVAPPVPAWQHKL